MIRNCFGSVFSNPRPRFVKLPESKQPGVYLRTKQLILLNSEWLSHLQLDAWQKPVFEVIFGMAMQLSPAVTSLIAAVQKFSEMLVTPPCFEMDDPEEDDDVAITVSDEDDDDELLKNRILPADKVPTLDLPPRFRRRPRNWPKNVKFTSGLIWKQEVPLLNNAFAPAIMKGVIIKKVSKSHPLFRDKKTVYGLFASAHLAKGRVLGSYAGVRQPTRNTEITFSEYICSVSDFDIDAQKYGNESRFINDFRNIAAAPNVIFRRCVHPQTGLIYCSVETTRDLKPDEEILVDYGIEYWKAQHELASQRNCYLIGSSPDCQEMNE